MVLPHDHEHNHDCHAHRDLTAACRCTHTPSHHAWPCRGLQVHARAIPLDPTWGSAVLPWLGGAFALYTAGMVGCLLLSVLNAWKAPTNPNITLTLPLPLSVLSA